MTDGTKGLTAAVSIKVPEQVSWAARRGEESWNGHDLSEFVECLDTQSSGEPITLSLTLIFELNGHNGTVQPKNE